RSVAALCANTDLSLELLGAFVLDVDVVLGLPVGPRLFEQFCLGVLDGAVNGDYAVCLASVARTGTSGRRTSRECETCYCENGQGCCEAAVHGGTHTSSSLRSSGTTSRGRPA